MINKTVFKKIFLRCYIAFIFLFLYSPIAVLIFFSFNKARGRGIWTGFTLDWYKRLFSNELILQSFFNTIIIAVISSIVATILGTMAAIGIGNFNKKNEKRDYGNNLYIYNKSRNCDGSFFDAFIRYNEIEIRIYHFNTRSYNI